MAEIAQSPLPPKKEEATNQNTYDFVQALDLLREGKKLGKIEWGDGWTVFFDNGILKIKKPDDSIHNWILSIADTTGTDYIIAK